MELKRVLVGDMRSEILRRTQASKKVSSLGSFPKLRKAIIGFVMSVCLSVRPSVHPHEATRHELVGWILIKFNIEISKIFR